MSIGKKIVSGKEADLIKELVAAGVKGAVKLTNDNSESSESCGSYTYLELR